MHGSFSWKKVSNSIVYTDHTDNNFDDSKRDDAEAVSKYLDDFALILPDLGKFHEALLNRTYYDLLRLYANSFDGENAVFFSFGFSFGDEHILDITKRGLRNPTSHLVIFAYDSEAVGNFEQCFSSQRNVTIVSPPTDGVLDFPGVNNLLRTITPSGV